MTVNFPLTLVLVRVTTLIILLSQMPQGSNYCPICSHSSSHIHRTSRYLLFSLQSVNEEVSELVR